MQFKWFIALPGCVLTCAILAPAQALAQQPQDQARAADWSPPLPAQRLEELRGGFELPNGLHLSFGIERAAYVNGQLVASTRVHIADVGRMTPEDARALAAATSPLLLQNGGGNIAGAGTGTRGGVVIQNSLDNQQIDSLTTLNIGVNTLDLFKAINANSALQDAINASPSGP